jgi:hypothetical protein
VKVAMTDAYRSPNAIEWALLKKLLEKSFPGRDDLLRQLDGLSVRKIDKEGSLSLRVDQLAPRAEVKDRVVAEGHYSDEDSASSEGPKVHVLLHVVKGKLTELEIYKDDGSPIRKGPLAQNLTSY